MKKVSWTFPILFSVFVIQKQNSYVPAFLMANKNYLYIFNDYEDALKNGIFFESNCLKGFSEISNEIFIVAKHGQIIRLLVDREPCESLKLNLVNF